MTAFHSATTLGLLALLGSQPTLAVADTSPPAFRSSMEPMVPANAALAAQFDLQHSNSMRMAATLLRDLGVAGTLSQDRVALAGQGLELLSLWDAPEPTELSDGSDGDFSLIWRRPNLSASLSYTEDEVVGYAYTPTMLTPWIFERDRISISELNILRRALG